MAQKRLNENHRRVLIDYAEQVVDCPKEKAATKKAYDAVAPLVTALVEKMFPPADMAVCKKYDAAWPDTCIKMQMPGGLVDQFTYESEEVAPLVARHNCSRQIYLADHKLTAKFEVWVSAAKHYTETKEALLEKYRAFIRNAKTFEEVLEVWPEAAAIAGRIHFNLPIALSEDDLALIKRDSQARMNRARAA